MATFVVGVLVAVALCFAVRHVYRNFCMGREDCCGSSCSSCDEHSGSCHSSKSQQKS